MKNTILTTFVFLVAISTAIAQICDPKYTERVPVGINDTMQVLSPISPQYSGKPQITEIDSLRMVYWVHGLNGNKGAWHAPASVSAYQDQSINFKARKLRSDRVDYNIDQDQGLWIVASDVVNEFIIHDDVTLNNPNYNWKDGFIISHSQGGIVGRAADRNYSEGWWDDYYRKFGGIITFATANQGAQIINNKVMVSDMLGSFAEEMSAGPLSEYEYSEKWIVRIISGWVLDEELKDTLVSVFANDIGKYLIDQNYPRITDDYQVGASHIDSLNSYQPDEDTTDIVAFYGLRDTLMYKYDVPYWDDHSNSSKTLDTLPLPISWSTMHYFINPASSEEPFVAEDNEHLTALRAWKWRHDYLTEVDFNKQLQKGIGFWKYLDIGLYNLWWRAEKRKNNWQRGVDFLDKFDQLYRVFIGARYSKPIQQYKEVCVCTKGTDTITMHEVPEHKDCDDFEFPGWDCNKDFEGETIGLRWYHKPSDGVVLVESAREIPQATHPPQKMEGSTHMRVRNDENLRNALNDIYDGEVGIFFKTKDWDE